MTTREIFDALAAPFGPDQVKSRVGQNGKVLHYITARTARQRLNEVLGPENWQCKIEASERWVKCSLTVAIPGLDTKAHPYGTITREALGGYPNMPTEEDKVKGGDSDAFKRACALFGIGEHLYGDDHPDLVTSRAAERPRHPEPVDPHPPSKDQVGNWFQKNARFANEEARKDYSAKPARGGWPKDGVSFYAWVMKIKDQYFWPSVLAELTENFIKSVDHGFPAKFKEWNPKQVEDAALWVANECAKTENYAGEFDEHIGARK